MGVVYKIKHQRMGKIAAMKVLHSEMAENPEVVARFQREAEAVSRLAHPNTVQVFDFGTTNGALYLVMEYVRGQDLGALIDRDGPMSFKDAAPLLGQICGSLEEAHDLGVVHRDLKPENLLVSRTHSGQDFVKVLDFGLAKLSEGEDNSSVKSARIDRWNAILYVSRADSGGGGSRSQSRHLFAGGTHLSPSHRGQCV